MAPRTAAPTTIAPGTKVATRWPNGKLHAPAWRCSWCRRGTQQCNNNAYNLDSPGIWLDWSLLASEERFHAFARSMLRFRRDHPALRPAAYRPFVDGNGNGLPAVAFFRDDGAVADAPYLDDASRHFLALRIDGEEAGDPARSLFIAYNGWDQGIVVTLPATATGQTCERHPRLARGRRELLRARPGARAPTARRVPVGRPRAADPHRGALSRRLLVRPAQRAYDHSVPQSTMTRP